MTYQKPPPKPCEVGDRIELIKMGNDPCPIKAGTQGTVICVGYISGAYQITVDWDSPRSLALVTPPDEFRVLPKEPEPAYIKCTFRPQAWIKDNAVDVDPEGPATWKVTLDQLVTLTGHTTTDTLEDDHYQRDELRHAPDAAQWIKDWSGPFEVEWQVVRPFQTTVIFGEEAAKAYFEDPEISDAKLDELGQYQTYSFDTKAELDAFHLGLKEIDGWAGYAIRTPNEPALV